MGKTMTGNKGQGGYPAPSGGNGKNKAKGTQGKGAKKGK